MHRELADRPVEIDVGNPSAALILAQKVVEPRHIALRFDDLSFHYNISAERPFTGDLQRDRQLVGSGQANLGGRQMSGGLISPTQCRRFLPRGGSFGSWKLCARRQ
jgi:hypothetical protein